MGLSHDEIKEMLPEYRRRELDGEAERETTAHLRDCAECRGALSVLAGLLALDVPDPGDLFWKHLPRRVRGTLEEDRSGLSALRSFLMRPAMAAATVTAFFLLLITVVIKRGADPELDPFFADPFSSIVLDYQGLTEEDLPLLTPQIPLDEVLQLSGDFTDYSFENALASLSSKEMDSLYEALTRKPRKGG
jgi:hypothetical protein